MDIGIIYKIQDNELGLIYIGKTCLNLNQRIYLHVNKLKCNQNYVSVNEIIERDNYTVSIIETITINNDISKLRLSELEAYYIKHMENVVNKNIPTPYKGYQYYLNVYKPSNIDNIKKYQKTYYEHHKEKLIEYQKNYRNKKKNELNN